jgi:hypothetical protein
MYVCLAAHQPWPLQPPASCDSIAPQVMGTIAQSSPVTRQLFHLAYESKRAALKRGDLSGGRFGPLWDRLVFSKVRARLGGGVSNADLMPTATWPVLGVCNHMCQACESYAVLQGVPCSTPV